MDLTLATPQGEPLDMGGEIDAVGPIGQPNHFADADPASAEGVTTSGAASCITPWNQRVCQAPQGVVALQLGRSALGLEQRGSCAHYGRSAQA